MDRSLSSDEYVKHLNSLGWVLSRALYSRPETDGPFLLELGIARTRILADTVAQYDTVSVNASVTIPTRTERSNMLKQYLVYTIPGRG